MLNKRTMYSVCRIKTGINAEKQKKKMIVELLL